MGTRRGLPRGSVHGRPAPARSGGACEWPDEREARLHHEGHEGAEGVGAVAGGEEGDVEGAGEEAEVALKAPAGQPVGWGRRLVVMCDLW